MKCSKAPGKVLLFGEHFVVAGKPALGLAVSRYAHVCVERGEGTIYSTRLGRLDPGIKHARLFIALFEASKNYIGGEPRVNVYVDSEIPMSAGMGSSAAIAVALAHSLLSYYGLNPSKEDIWKLAHEAEKAVHYKPSGVDTTLATYGGFLYYKQGEFRRLDLQIPPEYALVIVNTGVERSTGEVVRDVLERYRRLGKAGNYIYAAAEELVETALLALREGDMKKLGELMVVNHGLLWAMGASSRICDMVIYDLLENGVFGAKVSGAGRGGIVVGLSRRSTAEYLVRALYEKGFEAFIVEPDYEGVRGTQPISQPYTNLVLEEEDDENSGL